MFVPVATRDYTESLNVVKLSSPENSTDIAIAFS